MTDEKLARIRELAERDPFEHLEPATRGAIEELLAEGRSLYEGVCTLLGAPLKQDLTGLDVALIGVAFDLGVVHRPGARFGPRAVRNEGRVVGPYHHVTRVLPFALCQIADVGDAPLGLRFDLDSGIRAIGDFYQRVVDAGVIPVSVGGDHSITYPILKALGRERPVGLVHIDAHCDTAPAWSGSKFHHGGPFRNAAVAGVLDPERTIQIGIRGGAEAFWQFSYDSGMTVLHIEDVRRMGAEAVAAKAREVVGDGPVYVSFDVDGLDPVYAPGTGTPEVGGLTTLEAQTILRGLQGLDLVGGDVVEVAPEYDATSNTALSAATMLFEITCLVAERVSKRR